MSRASILAVRIYGTPRPQGSTRAFVVNGRARVTTDNKHLHGWRDDIKAAVEGKCAMVQKPTPVYVDVTFLMPRTTSLPKTREVAHTTKPDLDKLTRGLLDALVQGGVLQDDSQATTIIAMKRYAKAGEAPGADVTVGLFQEVQA